nr:TIGR02117 family protein [Jiella sp. LLJ827]
MLVAIALGVAIPRDGAKEPGEHVGSEGERILLVSGPIHTDIALPLTGKSRARFGFLEESGLPIDRPDALWLLVGWGGRSFYIETPTWSDLKPMPIVRTITGDRSALHLELAGAIDPSSPQVQSFVLAPTAMENLRSAILDSLQRDDFGRPREIAGAGYGLFDRFYEAKGRFQILINCNSWTSAMLREAGITTGLWTPLPVLLSLSLDLHAH